ncbi:MAG: hypothetical protein ACFB14_10940 [Leptolyngbyaceae cyanobacterium]
MGSSETALWMENIVPEYQGRVFAANTLTLQGVSAIPALLAGPLAERFLIPIMQSPTGVAHWFILLLGTGDSAGLSILYVLSALSMMLVGLMGVCLPQLHSFQRPSE